MLEFFHGFAIGSNAVISLSFEDVDPGRIRIKGFQMLEGCEGFVELFRLEIGANKHI